MTTSPSPIAGLPPRFDLDTVRALVRADEACRDAQLVVERLRDVIADLPRNGVGARKRDATAAANEACYSLEDCLLALDDINNQIKEQIS